MLTSLIVRNGTIARKMARLRGRPSCRKAAAEATTNFGRGNLNAYPRRGHSEIGYLLCLAACLRRRATLARFLLTPILGSRRGFERLNRQTARRAVMKPTAIAKE
jgi:hypothetical protein